MIDPDVRPATNSDVEELRSLEAEARAGLVDSRGGRRWLEEHPVIGPRWGTAVRDRGVFVAELAPPGTDHRLVVGYLIVDIDGPVAHVDQVYVTEPARSLGFGDALLEAATQRARTAGADVIEGHALPGDRDTKNLYERAHITARLITVSRRLD